MRTWTVLSMLAALGVLGAGCPGETDDDDVSQDDDDTSEGDDDTSGGDDDSTDPPMEPVFTFAVIADPHAYGSADNLARLTDAVTWISDQTAAQDIQLVLVLGDVAWNDGIADARAALDTLPVPYVPINGDNEVHSGEEQALHDGFATHFDHLATVLEDFHRAGVPVWHPEAEQDAWFLNTSFTHGGVHFVGLDWAARGVDGILSEAGHLHDFEGGTWPWFEDELGALGGAAEESVVLFTHIPMHLGAFDLEQMAQIAAVTAPMADRVAANLAGHVHVNAEIEVEDGGYTVYVTDAVWDDENTVRLVRVSGNGLRFEFEHELVVVP